MNKFIFSILIMGFYTPIFGQQADSTLVLSRLDFADVAASYNTQNKNGVPLEFIDGLVVETGLLNALPSPLEVAIVLPSASKVRDLEVLRWDGSLRRWMSFSNSQLKESTDGIQNAVSFMVSKEGKYGVFYSNHVKAYIEIQLPPKHQCTAFRFVQYNTRVVYEGTSAQGLNMLMLPIENPSPRADLTLTCRDQKLNNYVIREKFGTLLKSDGDEYINRDFKCELKSNQFASR